MKAPRPWHVTFFDFTSYLRRCGWRAPIIMRGRKVRVVGMGAWPRGRLYANDNRRRA